MAGTSWVCCSKGTRYTSILVEVAFLSNPKEEKQLKTAKFQKKLAKAIYLGTKKYIKSGVTISSTNDPDN